MLSRNKTIRLLSILSAVLIAAAFLMAMFYAPVEINMGMVQKVFYFHVSSAWVGMLAFLVAAVSGVQYLRTRNRKHDTLGASSVEIGLLFSAIANFTGMIWARPIWNTWWTWDPRLTTMTIMAFTYIAYLLLRRGMEDPARRAQFSATYAIIGFASVPLTFFSSRLLRSIHPTVFGASADMNMTPEMLVTMFAAIIAFTVLYFALLLQRDQLMREQDELAEAEAIAEQEELEA